MCVDEYTVWFGHSISLCEKVCFVKLASVFDENEVPGGHSGFCASEKAVSETFGVSPHRNSTAVTILPSETRR